MNIEIFIQSTLALGISNTQKYEILTAYVHKLQEMSYNQALEDAVKQGVSVSDGYGNYSNATYEEDILSLKKNN
jgi:hypothetical protein